MECLCFERCYQCSHVYEVGERFFLAFYRDGDSISFCVDCVDWFGDCDHQGLVDVRQVHKIAGPDIARDLLDNLR